MEAELVLHRRSRQDCHQIATELCQPGLLDQFDAKPVADALLGEFDDGRANTIVSATVLTSSPRRGRNMVNGFSVRPSVGTNFADESTIAKWWRAAFTPIPESWRERWGLMSVLRSQVLCRR